MPSIRLFLSLCVPYELGGVQRPLYPDFLIVRSTPSGLEVDLFDPHLPTLEDAPAKAAGLANYADKHWPLFGRIELIIVEGDELKRLDLVNEQIRDKLKGVHDHAHFVSYSSPSRAEVTPSGARSRLTLLRHACHPLISG